MPVALTGIYRENVAALLVRRDGQVLVGECADKPGCWSFPQGGVAPGETRREALARELAEETGMSPRDYRILRTRGGYAYDYPGGRLKKGIYRGQRQTYFLCLMLRDGPVARRNWRGKSREFLRLAWVRPSTFDLGMVPVFKRTTVRGVLADFFGVDRPLPDAADAVDAADVDPDVML